MYKEKIMNMSLHNLEQIAQGGQSKIYNYDNDNILRVPQRELDYKRVKYEYEVYKLIQEYLDVPHVKELIEIDNKPCIIMEKILGIDLVKELQVKPYKLFSLPGKLAQLHTSIFQVSISDKLSTNHENAHYCIKNSKLLSDEQKRKLQNILENLDKGSSLCHGDFHPGNIIISKGKNFIIDWSSASSGSIYFDIAHTYLLMINTPKTPNIDDNTYKLQKVITKYIGVHYLKKICKLNNIDSKTLWPYFLIKIAERTFYGIENEKQILMDYINRNIDVHTNDLKSIKKLA